MYLTIVNEVIILTSLKSFASGCHDNYGNAIRAESRSPFSCVTPAPDPRNSVGNPWYSADCSLEGFFRRRVCNRILSAAAVVTSASKIKRIVAQDLLEFWLIDNGIEMEWPSCSASPLRTAAEIENAVVAMPPCCVVCAFPAAGSFLWSICSRHFRRPLRVSFLFAPQDCAAWMDCAEGPLRAAGRFRSRFLAVLSVCRNSDCRTS